MTHKYPTLILIATFLTLSGCRSYDSSQRPNAFSIAAAKPQSRVLLASYRAQAAPEQPKDKENQPSQETRDESQPDAKPENAPPVDPDEEATKKTPVPIGYTAPGAAIRQAALLAIAISTGEAGASSEFSGGGKELAESMTSVPTAVVGSGGRAGLASAGGGRRGLQEGPGTGIGFAESFGPNILSPQRNPLSGAMGRCNDLIMAGFFGGNSANCVSHFRQQ